MEYDLTLFEKGLEELGITLSQDQKKQFITYYEYLVEKNKVMNLTAITEYDEVILKHFLDSLSIVKAGCFDQKKLAGKSLIDIGTGAFSGDSMNLDFSSAFADAGSSMDLAGAIDLSQISLNFDGLPQLDLGQILSGLTLNVSEDGMNQEKVLHYLNEPLPYYKYELVEN